MATQSPNIYFYENDNTQYENPKTISGTTVAVVGFARRGPIGVPTPITSYNDFISIFGSPIDGMYSNLAVKNVLSAGGGVIFVRVADKTATPSNVIIKNGSEGYNGKTYLDKVGNILIGTKGYENSSIYAMDLTSKGNKKTLYVRSPNKDQFTQTSIFEQLNNELRKSKASYEVLSRGKSKKGLYSFEIAWKGSDDSDEEYKVKDIAGLDIEPEAQGFFVEVDEDMKPDLLELGLKNALSNGTNITYSLVLDNVKEFAEEEKNFELDTVTVPIGQKGFRVKIGDKEFTSTVIVEENDKLSDIVRKIDEDISKNGVRCILVNGSEASLEPEAKAKAPKIIFINVGKNSNENIKILSLLDNQITEEVKNLFFANTDVEGISNITSFQDEDNKFYIRNAVLKEKGQKRETATVEYNKDTKSFIFKGVSEGTGNKIKAVKAPYGNFIFDTINGCGINGENNIFEFDGQDGIEGVEIKKENKKIVFESIDAVEFPKVEKTVNSNPNLFSLLDIMKDPYNAESTGYTEVEGSFPVDPKSKDMVVITSKNLGSGTNNIDVEFHTTKSPIESVPDMKSVYVYVNGEKLETYEDINYIWGDENSFEKKINLEEDNGGSKYINVYVNKIEEKPEITLRDGIFTVGKPEKDSSIKRDESTAVEEYTEYDYSVGTDGITSDGGNQLFLDAMDKMNSPLSDEQLYNFHVIIHPDNTTMEVQDAAITLCEARKDCMTIIDPPAGLSKEAVIDWHNGKGSYGRTNAIDSNYAATYWPWCKVYDTTFKKYLWVMPSVIMAAKYVTVDRTSGCWYAPAGEANGRLSVTDIEKYPNKYERGDLYLDYNRINPFMKMQDGTILCYGEKTLQRKNSVLTKIHTRRMMIQIKKEVREALRGYIFMPNTTDYLSKINSKVTAILERYKIGGGLASYRVVCDETNNTTVTRQQDIINVAISLVPEGVIEEIRVTFNINKTDKEVTTD